MATKQQQAEFDKRLKSGKWPKELLPTELDNFANDFKDFESFGAGFRWMLKKPNRMIYTQVDIDSPSKKAIRLGETVTYLRGSHLVNRTGRWCVIEK